MTQSPNPLSKHFRQPQLYLKLPSAGRWWPAGSIDIPVTGELPVFAMTAKDELTMKTPDALLNGQSTVDVVQSCIPSIKDAWKMPSVDLDAILIAIRQATYGNHMEFVSVCPHCQRKNEREADLSVIAQSFVCPNFEEVILIEDLEIYLKPQNYFQFNKASMENFEQQRILAVVGDKTLSDEDKLLKFNELFRKLLSLTVEQVTKGVAGIKTEDGVLVEDRDQLDEFFANCNRPVWDAVKTRLETLADQTPLKHVKVECEHDDCGKGFETPLVFEMSSFFA
jgi:hypothetical protein